MNYYVPFETRPAISTAAPHPYIYVSNRVSSAGCEELRAGGVSLRLARRTEVNNGGSRSVQRLIHVMRAAELSTFVSQCSISVPAFMKYQKYPKPNGRSPLFNQLFDSVVNFLLKLLFGVIGRKKAALKCSLKRRSTGRNIAS